MATWTQRKDLGVVLRYYPQTRLPMCSGRSDSLHMTGSLVPIHSPVKPIVLRIDTEAVTTTRHESSYRGSEREERSLSTRRTLRTQGGRRNMEQSFERRTHPLTYAQISSQPHSPCKPSFPSPSKPLYLPPCLYSKAPLSKAKWPATTRLLWKRRLTQRSAPLVIVHFEGVVGEFRREPWTAGLELCVREGVERGLAALLQRYQVALVTALGKDQRKSLLDCLKKRSGLVFDAVYKIRKSDGTSFLLDYSQILSDFTVSPHKIPSPSLNSTLIVSSIGLNQDDLGCRQGLDLLYESSVSHFRRYLWYGIDSHAAPLPGPVVPICLFLPHPLAQDSNTCLPFEEVVTIVGELAGKEGLFNAGYEALDEDPVVSGVKKGEVALGLLVQDRRELQGRQARWEEGRLRFLVQCGRRFALGEFAPLQGRKAGSKQAIKLVV